jgi:hypothetical protein
MFSFGIPFIATFALNIPASGWSGSTATVYLGLVSRTYRSTSVFPAPTTANSSTSGFYAWRISSGGVISIQEGTNNATASWTNLNNSTGTYTQPSTLSQANYGSTATFSIIYSGNTGTPGQFQYAINGTVFCTSVVTNPSTNITPLGLGLYINGAQNVFPIRQPIVRVTFSQGLGATGPTGNTGNTGATGLTGPTGALAPGNWTVDTTNTQNLYLLRGNTMIATSLPSTTSATLFKLFSNEVFIPSIAYSVFFRFSGITFPNSAFNIYFGLVSNSVRTFSTAIDQPGWTANGPTSGTYLFKITFNNNVNTPATVINEGGAGAINLTTAQSVTTNSTIGISYQPTSSGGGRFTYLINGIVVYTSTQSLQANIPPLGAALFIPTGFYHSGGVPINSPIGSITVINGSTAGPTGDTGNTGPTGLTGAMGPGNWSVDTSKTINAMIQPGMSNMMTVTANTASRFFSNETYPLNVPFSAFLRLNFGTSFPTSGNMAFGLTSNPNEVSTINVADSSMPNIFTGLNVFYMTFPSSGNILSFNIRESTNVTTTSTNTGVTFTHNSAPSATPLNITWVSPYGGQGSPTVNITPTSILGVVYLPNSSTSGTVNYIIDGIVVARSIVPFGTWLPAGTGPSTTFAMGYWNNSTVIPARTNLGLATFSQNVGATGPTGQTGLTGNVGPTGMAGLGTYTWDTANIANAKTSGVNVQSINQTPLTAASNPPASLSSNTFLPPTAVVNFADSAKFPFAFTNEGYTDPFSIAFVLENTGVPDVTRGTTAAAFNLYFGLTQNKRSSLTSTDSLSASSYQALTGEMSPPTPFATRPSGAWSNDLVPAFDYMFSVGRARNGWNLTSMIENGGANGSSAPNYKETLFSNNTDTPFITSMFVGATKFTYLNIAFDGTSIIYTVNNRKWRQIYNVGPLQNPLYGAIMLGILPSSVRVSIASFTRVGSSVPGPRGPMGSSVLSIKPINNTPSSPAIEYNSTSNLALSGNVVAFNNVTNTGSNVDVGGEWAFITAPIVSGTTVNFVINLPEGYNSTTAVKRIEVGLRRIRNTIGGTPGADITLESPSKNAPSVDSFIDYSIYIVNDRFMIRATPLVSVNTVNPASTINNTTTSANYGRLSVLTSTGSYTNATGGTDVTLLGDTNQAQWYIGPGTEPLTLNISIVFSGSSISYYINGNVVTTRLGNSVPCILSSAPYYAAVRVLSTPPVSGISNDTISMNLLPAAGATGAFTSTNLTLVSKAPSTVLNLGNANSISVVKSGPVTFSDNPFVFSANPLTGPFVLNFMFNTDRGASQAAADGSAVSGAEHAVEFAVGFVTTVEARESFNAQGSNTFTYGMMVNGTAVGYKLNTGGPVTVGANPATASPNPAAVAGMSTSATQTIPRGGNHSLQIRFDGTNMSYYVDGVIVAGTGFTFAPTNRGPYYLVMSFANSNQFSSIPLGQTVPPTNFTLQVTMSELFGSTNLLGTTLTHLQTFTTAYTMVAAASALALTPYVSFTKDNTNSSTATAEVVYTTADGLFTYSATDGTSKAMINLTINVAAAATFNMRYLVFASGVTTPKITGPTIPASGTGAAWGLTMKVSFILSNGDRFILQAWGSATPFLAGSTVIVEKLPVAQGGGGKAGEEQRWINVKPIPKRHPSRKSSLRISRMSTKKGGRK